MITRGSESDQHQFRWLWDWFDSRFIRFLAVGCSNFVVSYSVFWGGMQVFPLFRLRVFLSQIISYSAGIVWSYFWNRKITFSSRGPVAAQMARFVFLQVILALATALLISIGVDRLGFSPAVSWLAVMIPATLVNFLVCRWWVFR